MSDIPQTDVSRPSALPTAKLLQRPTQPLVDQDSNEYLDAIEEEWNKKVDMEIETLVDGMVDLVGLASVSVAASISKVQERYSWPADWKQGQVSGCTRIFPGRMPCGVDGMSPSLCIDG